MDNFSSHSKTIFKKEPWSDVTEFQKLDKRVVINVSGIKLDYESLMSLYPKNYVEDSILDAFGLMILNNYSDNDTLIFNTQHVVSIINRNYSIEDVLKWCNLVRAKSYHIRIFPIFYREHWTSMIILSKQCCIIYLNSLHAPPNEKWVHLIYDFIRKIEKKQ